MLTLEKVGPVIKVPQSIFPDDCCNPESMGDPVECELEYYQFEFKGRIPSFVPRKMHGVLGSHAWFNGMRINRTEIYKDFCSIADENTIVVGAYTHTNNGAEVLFKPHDVSPQKIKNFRPISFDIQSQYWLTNSIVIDWNSDPDSYKTAIRVIEIGQKLKDGKLSMVSSLDEALHIAEVMDDVFQWEYRLMAKALAAIGWQA